jgi:hypothetical protein
MFLCFKISRGACEWYKNQHRPRSAYMKVYPKILGLIVTLSLTAAVRMEIKELEEVKLGRKFRNSVAKIFVFA